MTSHRNALRQYRQLLACVVLVLATGAISTSLLRGASLNTAGTHPQSVLRGASVSTGGMHPRRPGRFSGAGTDSQVVYSVQRFTHTSSSSIWDDDGDNFNADTVNGRRYIVQLNSSAGMSKLRLSVNGQEFVGQSEGTILEREIDVTSGTNSFDIQTKGSAGSWVDVRIVRVSDPTFIVYGPKTFTQPSPAAKQVDTFSIAHAAKSPYTLRVINGSGSGSNRVTNATLGVNGVAVMGASDLGTGRATKTYNVTLDTSSVNRDTLYNQTATGTYLSLRFTATDSTPPNLVVSVPADTYSTRGGVRTTGSVTDETYGILTIDTLATATRAAIATPGTFSDSLTMPSIDGKYRLRYHAINSAWLTTDVSRIIIRDTRAPTLNIDSLNTDQHSTTATAIRVSGSWVDSSKTTVTVDGDTVGYGATGTFSYVYPLDYGQNVIVYRAVDAVGHVKEERRYVARGVDNSSASDSTLALLGAMQTGITPFLRSVDFLYAGETGFDSTKIDTNLAAVVRGLVVGRDYTGIGDVTVSVLGDSVLGSTKTRKDGRFDLIVNGGHPLTLRFTKTNFLESQRTITPLWNDYATLDTVAMVGATSRVTGISLSTDTVATGRFATDTVAQYPFYDPRVQELVNTGPNGRFSLNYFEGRAVVVPINDILDA